MELTRPCGSSLQQAQRVGSACTLHRRSGEQAMATIVTADETHIRAAQGGSVIRFTFDVKPRAGEPFRAETQAAVADQSRANTLLDNRYTSGTIHLVIQSKSRWIPLHKII